MLYKIDREFEDQCRCCACGMTKQKILRLVLINAKPRLKEPIDRTWQINKINRINNRLINRCKLGLRLIRINNRSIWINNGLIPINNGLIWINNRLMNVHYPFRLSA